MNDTQLVTIENVGIKDEENLEIKIIYFDTHDELKRKILKSYIVRVAELCDDTLKIYCKITDVKDN